MSENTNKNTAEKPRPKPSFTWVVYDTDGDGEEVPGSREACENYGAAEAEYGRRLWDNDYRCKGFFAAPHLSCIKDN